MGGVVWWVWWCGVAWSGVVCPHAHSDLLTKSGRACQVFRESLSPMGRGPTCRVGFKSQGFLPKAI
eukprot:10888884-Prorocentrum_lima.AAC.1